MDMKEGESDPESLVLVIKSIIRNLSRVTANQDWCQLFLTQTTHTQDGIVIVYKGFKWISDTILTSTKLYKHVKRNLQQFLMLNVNLGDFVHEAKL